MPARIVAVYRLLYGSDFIAESISSVYDACDAVLCFVGRKPFGGRDSVEYFGREVFFPHDIDGVADTIRAWCVEHDQAGKVRIIENPYDAVLENQLASLVDEFILPHYDCSHVLQVEFDEVWRADMIRGLAETAAMSDADELLATSDLFWRAPWFVSRRDNPYAIMRRITDACRIAGTIGPTGNALMSARNDLKRERVEAHPHNFGYASSTRTMFWKHLTGLSFSRDLRMDSVPREEWFEDVWRVWNWETNRRTDLCPSIGYPDAFAPAEHYPPEQLPASIQHRIACDPLPEWAQAGLPVALGEAALRGGAA